MKHSLHIFYSLFLFLLLPSLSLAQSDCRLKKENLKPVIKRFNPFFSNHSWDGKSQIELAQMGTERLILITQGGCKRHHTTFNLVIDKEATFDRKDFWISEVKTMMHRVFWDLPDYESFGKDFEALFIKKFNVYGVNNQFNFPIGTRNFICEINYSSQRGAKITIEMVSFIFKERVKTERRGISTDKDDGWYGNEKKP